MGAFARLLFLLAATLAVHGLSLRKSRKGPLDTPSQIGYEPEDLLCKLGKKTQGWCMDWIACIRDKASGQASKVNENMEPTVICCFKPEVIWFSAWQAPGIQRPQAWRGIILPF